MTLEHEPFKWRDDVRELVCELLEKGLRTETIIAEVQHVGETWEKNNA